MKISFCLQAVAATVLLAACGQTKGSTHLTASLPLPEEGENPAEVTIYIAPDQDSTVQVSDGKFEMDVPTDRYTLGFAVYNDKRIMFIPDGTDIKLDFDTEKAISKTHKGANANLYEYLEKTEALKEKLTLIALEGGDNKGNEDEEMKAYHAFEVNTVRRNSDNILGVIAIANMQSDDNALMLSLLDGLDDKLKADPGIQKMIEAYKAESKTGNGEMFLDFEADGKKLSDYVGKGKYVIVDFWASWCAPCREEIPNLKAVYEKYRGDRFDMVSVAVWDKPEDTAAEAKRSGITWNQMVNAQSKPTELYGIQGIPHIILFDPEGRIVKRDLRGDAIEAAVAEALGK